MIEYKFEIQFKKKLNNMHFSQTWSAVLNKTSKENKLVLISNQAVKCWWLDNHFLHYWNPSLKLRNVL